VDGWSDVEAFGEFFARINRIDPYQKVGGWSTFQARDPTVTYDLCTLDPRKLYINFGFNDRVKTKYEMGHFNWEVER
jgi:hypothetical protein